MDQTPLASTTAGEPGGADATATRLLPDARQAPSAVPSARLLGPYRLLRVIGRGGMGAVWEAVDTRLNRRVAVKVALTGASPEAAERFRHEATHAARLRHPHIVPVHDVGQDQGQWYLVMDLVRGITLADARRAGVLSYRHAAALLEQVARAVAYAHGEGVVHRDLKPENIMLELPSMGSSTTNAQQQATWETLLPQAQPLVMDFGLAKDLTSSSDLSQTGVALGTPAYMPPEQAEGRTELVGRAADIYSIGAILYELTTGRPPFTGENAMQVLHQVVHDDPLPPRRIVRSIPRDLETICLACLQKDPARRPSAGALADDLRAFQLGEPIQARRTSLAARGLRTLRRHRRTALTLVLVGLIGLALGALYLEHLQEQSQWRVVAEESFSDATWRDRWLVHVGGAHRDHGHLRTTGTLATVLIWKKRLEGPVAIDYDACSLPGALSGDLSFIWAREIHTPSQGVDPLAGLERPISCQFGFMDGSYTAMLVDDTEVDSHPLHPQPGVWHHCRVEIVDTRIRMCIDGTEVLRYEDAFPLTGGYACLYGYYPDKAFGPVRISTLSLPQKVPATAVGDAFAQNGEYRAAERVYDGVADAYPATPLAQEARYKAGVCASRLGEERLAEQEWAPLRTTAYGSRIAVDRLDALLDRALPPRPKDPQDPHRVDALLDGMAACAATPDLRRRIAVLWARCAIRAAAHREKPLLTRLLRLHDATLSQEHGIDGTAARTLHLLGRDEEILQRYPDLRWMCAEALTTLGRMHECVERYPDVRGVYFEALFTTGEYAKCLALATQDHIRIQVPDILIETGHPDQALQCPDIVPEQRAYALLALGRLADAQRACPESWWGSCAAVMRGLPSRPSSPDAGLLARGAYDQVLQTSAFPDLRLLARQAQLLAQLVANPAAPGVAAALAGTRIPLSPQLRLSNSFIVDQVTVLPFTRDRLGDDHDWDRTLASLDGETRWMLEQQLWYAAMRAGGRLSTAAFLAQPYQLGIRVQDELWQAFAADKRGERAQAAAHYATFLRSHRWQRGPDFDVLRELCARWRLRVLGGDPALWSRPSPPDEPEAPVAPPVTPTPAATAPALRPVPVRTAPGQAPALTP